MCDIDTSGVRGDCGTLQWHETLPMAESCWVPQAAATRGASGRRWLWKWEIPLHQSQHPHGEGLRVILAQKLNTPACKCTG